MITGLILKPKYPKAKTSNKGSRFSRKEDYSSTHKYACPPPFLDIHKDNMQIPTDTHTAPTTNNSYTRHSYNNISHLY